VPAANEASRLTYKALIGNQEPQHAEKSMVLAKRSG
jgi:hypothetical protein